MADKNEITGASLSTGLASEAYKENFDKIFNKPKQQPTQWVLGWDEKCVNHDIGKDNDTEK